MESRRGLLKKTLGGAVLLAVPVVFPTSLGVNPMESIYGIASRASGHVLKALS